MSEQITYAKVGGPPDNWKGLKVFDSAGEEVKDVVEVDVTKGFVRRASRGLDGRFEVKNGEIQTEVVNGAFTIRLPE